MTYHPSIPAPVTGRAYTLLKSSARLRIPSWLALALWLPACALDATSDAPPATRERTQALASRLIAPCCWVQTLDVHESTLASQLRREIGERLNQGESAAAIEDDLAARFGERVRAVPRGEDPRMIVPSVVAATMALVLLSLFMLASNWVRRGQRMSAPAERDHDAYDQHLDRELARLED